MTAHAAARVRDARLRLRERRPVVLDGPGGPAWVAAAQFAATAPSPLAAMAGTGPVGLVLEASRWEELGVPAGGRRPRALALATTARLGDRTTRAVSAIAAALDPATGPGEIVSGDAIRPHDARPGGVRSHPGTAEAALELVRGAGLVGAALLVPARAGAAGAHAVSVDDVAEAAWRDVGVARVRSRVLLPTVHGALTVVGAETPDDGGEHLAMWSPHLPVPPDDVAIEAPCWRGHALGGVACGCGARMRAALGEAAAGRLLLVHVGAPRGGGAGTHPAAGCGAVDARARGIAAALARLCATPSSARAAPAAGPRAVPPGVRLRPRPHPDAGGPSAGPPRGRAPRPQGRPALRR